jgi:Mg2+ and Co2+ transporter CorA
MDVHLVSDRGPEQHAVEDLKQLLDRADGFLWLDIQSCDEQATRVLSKVFGFHRIAVQSCVQRNHVSKVHIYPDHIFVVLHAPHLGKTGHVHYIELDQFIGPNYLITVHGPLNPAVDPEVALRETRMVLRRIEQGHLHPTSPAQLSYAIVSTVTRRQNDFIADLAQESGRLEKRVMIDTVMDDPEQFLDELFRTWYELLAVRTMAAHSCETFGRIAALNRSRPADAPSLAADLADQFSRVKSLADGQREFLHGVIEFYRTRLDTQRTISADQLAATAVQQNDYMRKITAWVAIIAVPTAVTGFFGQNIPYPGFGEQAGFIASAAIMVAIAIVLYVIFKRKQWL